MTFPGSWLRVALIDLDFDWRKFGVLIACIALGVAAIAAVGSVGSALENAVGRDARSFLGGDLEASIGYRPANAEELALFHRLGRVSEVVDIAARATAGGKSALIGLHAVDDAYPLLGAVVAKPASGAAGALSALLAPRNGIPGAVAEPLLFDRLGLRPGDLVRIGNQSFRLTGTLEQLPDQALRGFEIGATVLVSTQSLAATGLLGPGVLARYRYKILLAGTPYADAAAEIRKRFPDAGWQVRSPREATAGLTHYLDLFERFLVLVGLSSLLVGGIGVANAVSAYVTGRERSIATFRSLGATGRRVMVHFLFQIMLLGFAGTAIGVAFGALATLALLPLLAGYLDIELPAALYPAPLGLGALFGLLIAFVFAYLPLLRAARLPPAALFRAAGGDSGRLLSRSLLRPLTGGPLLIGILLMVGLALAVTRDPELVFWFAGGAAAAVIALRLVAFLLQRLLRLFRPARSLVLRLALRRLYRRGSPTPTVVLSLGLGLTLMLAIALVDSSLRNQLAGDMSRSAPSFVLINVDKPTATALTAFARTDRDVASLDFVPYLRGIITKVGKTPVADLKGLDANDRRRLGGDQALSWRADLPKGDKVLAGTWWPADYGGPPLVSLDEDFTRPLGLKVGETLEIAISGRPLAVTIANIRRVDWQNASLSFNILFSPGLIEGAPATDLGALKARPGAELAVEAALVARFPSLAFVPVGAALAQISAVVSALANAVALVGGVALLSGVFVLAGAIAAGRRQREAEAVVTKVLGATRRQLALAFLVEYGLLGLLAALVAAGLGAIAGWAVTARLLELTFHLDGPLIAEVALAAVAVTIVTGLVMTWSTLRTRPVAFLRAEE